MEKINYEEMTAKLKVGMRFKDRKELFEFIGIPYYNVNGDIIRGNSLRAINNEIDKYVTVVRDGFGRSLFVKETNKKYSTISYVRRSKGKYSSVLEKLIYTCVCNTNTNSLDVSAIELAENIGLIHKTYRFKNLKHGEYFTYINENGHNVCCGKLENILCKTIKNTIKSLNNRGVISVCKGSKTRYNSMLISISSKFYNKNLLLDSNNDYEDLLTRARELMRNRLKDCVQKIFKDISVAEAYRYVDLFMFGDQDEQAVS